MGDLIRLWVLQEPPPEEILVQTMQRLPFLTPKTLGNSQNHRLVQKAAPSGK